MDFRRKLAVARRKQRISQEAAGARIGITRSAVAKFEGYYGGFNYITLLKYIDAIGYKIILVKKSDLERSDDDLDPQ